MNAVVMAVVAVVAAAVDARGATEGERGHRCHNRYHRHQSMNLNCKKPKLSQSPSTLSLPQGGTDLTALPVPSLFACLQFVL